MPILFRCVVESLDVVIHTLFKKNQNNENNNINTPYFYNLLIHIIIHICMDI